MKRPVGLYFITFWFFLGFGSLTWTPISRTVLSKVVDDPSVIKFVATVGLFFIIYVTVGLIQIKKTQVTIAIWIFACMSLFYLITAISFVGTSTFDNKTITILVYKIFMILPSAICAYYLLQPNFRKFQTKYLEYKQQESHAKWVQKNASKL